ncbi:hypothetical protein PRK78_002639 [Emydomyces testavorans]|uniref:Uncharacterized protein n=1 Tax=Emydomyces testavorans TaxID=2070801 RepID=A0AAF0IHR9_9EURO|nr:hypothetical protein PRK78_002639 [Emydomyces testavorans]
MPMAMNTVQIPEEYDMIDLLNSWQHKLLTYLARDKSEVLKHLMNEDLEGFIEPVYLDQEHEILENSNEDESSESTEPSSIELSKEVNKLQKKNT